MLPAQIQFYLVFIFLRHVRNYGWGSLEVKQIICSGTLSKPKKQTKQEIGNYPPFFIMGSLFFSPTIIFVLPDHPLFILTEPFLFLLTLPVSLLQGASQQTAKTDQPDQPDPWHHLGSEGNLGKLLEGCEGQTKGIGRQRFRHSAKGGNWAK